MINSFRKISGKLFVSGFLFIAGNTYFKIQYEQIKNQGIATSASVTSISYDLGKDSNGKYSAELYLKYIDRNGVTQTGKTDIGKIDDKIREDIKNNPVVNIKYLEKSPSKVLALSYSEDPIKNVLFSIGMTIFGGGGLFLCRHYSPSTSLKSKTPKKLVINKDINLKKK